MKLFPLCNSKTQKRYTLQDVVSISKRDWGSLMDSLPNFLRNSDQASKCIWILLLKPNVNIGSKNSKKNKLFTHCHKNFFEYSCRKLHSTSRFGNNKPRLFSIKNFELLSNQLTLANFFNLKFRNFHNFLMNWFYVATNVKRLRAVTMFSNFAPYFRYDNSISKPIGNLYGPNAMCF